MPQNYLRYIVGAIIVGGHIGLLIVVLTYLSKLLEPDQQTKVLLSLGPVASTYFVAVVKTAIRERHNFSPSLHVSIEFSAIAIALSLVFVGGLYYFCLGFPNAIAQDTDSLSKWILGVEVALGGSLGLVVDVLFPTGPAGKLRQDRAIPRRPAAPRSPSNPPDRRTSP
jgi:hypothetical protein